MKTCLFEKHCALNAKMVDFCGWQMPLQYAGVLHEHHTVREAVGVFDVSHMGRVLVKGPGAESLLDFLSTNTLAGKQDHTATYTVWPNAQGGSVDDVIVYKNHSQDFFVVVNASNRQKDLLHLKQYAKDYDVHIEDTFDSEGILAVQGPRASQLLPLIFPMAQPVKPMRIQTITYGGMPVILSGTGYTGSGGFEIYAPKAIITELWDKMLLEGKPLGIEPIGLGARDTLRLEKGYALYGHELSDHIAATESVAAWTVHMDKSDFLGKAQMQRLEHSPSKRASYGVILLEPGIAREGCKIYDNDRCIGNVTSGAFAPVLKQAVALILVQGHYHAGDTLQVEVRNKKIPAQIVKLPFLK